MRRLNASCGWLWLFFFFFFLRGEFQFIHGFFLGGEMSKHAYLLLHEQPCPEKIAAVSSAVNARARLSINNECTESWRDKSWYNGPHPGYSLFSHLTSFALCPSLSFLASNFGEIFFLSLFKLFFSFSLEIDREISYEILKINDEIISDSIWF